MKIQRSSWMKLLIHIKQISGLKDMNGLFDVIGILQNQGVDPIILIILLYLPSQTVTDRLVALFFSMTNINKHLQHSPPSQT